METELLATTADPHQPGTEQPQLDQGTEAREAGVANLPPREIRPLTEAEFASLTFPMALHEYAAVFSEYTSDEDRANIGESLKQGFVASAGTLTLYRAGAADPFVLLDGANRQCAALGGHVKLEAKNFVVFTGTQNEAFRYVLTLNLFRRHLNLSQRAMLASDLKECVERDRHQGAGEFANVKGKSRDVAAAMANVSPRSVQDAETVRNAATPATVTKVRAGKMTVSAAMNSSAVRAFRNAKSMEGGPSEPRPELDFTETRVRAKVPGKGLVALADLTQDDIERIPHPDVISRLVRGAMRWTREDKERLAVVRDRLERRVQALSDERSAMDPDARSTLDEYFRRQEQKLRPLCTKIVSPRRRLYMTAIDDAIELRLVTATLTGNGRVQPTVVALHARLTSIDLRKIADAMDRLAGGEQHGAPESR